MTSEATEPILGGTVTTDPVSSDAGVGDLDGDGDASAFERLLVLAATLAAASVARKVAAMVWKASTGRTPPSASDARADTSVVILWGAAAGAAIGAARLLAERQARSLAHRSHE